MQAVQVDGGIETLSSRTILVSGGGALGGCSRSGAGFGSGRCRCRRRIPAAGGGRYVDGVVGLRLRREGLDREPGGSQRLGVEALGDIVALAAGVGVALGSGEAEPFEGFGEVLFDADAAGIEDA